MESSYEKSREILETSITSEKPVKDLMVLAGQFVENMNTDGLHDIDVALTGLLIDFIRHGTLDMFDTFIEDMLIFLDSDNGDRLKSFIEGERYFYRWEHLVDFSRMTFEEYDPDMTARFIASRKYGVRLLEIVSENTDGIRVKELAKKLDISNQQLAKLLREFEEHDLVEREKGKKMTLVHLGFMGRVYMSEKEESQASDLIEPAEAIPLYMQQGDILVPDRYQASIPSLAGLES